MYVNYDIRISTIPTSKNYTPVQFNCSHKYVYVVAAGLHFLLG